METGSSTSTLFPFPPRVPTALPFRPIRTDNPLNLQRDNDILWLSFSKPRDPRCPLNLAVSLNLNPAVSLPLCFFLRRPFIFFISQRLAHLWRMQGSRRPWSAPSTPTPSRGIECYSSLTYIYITLVSVVHGLRLWLPTQLHLGSYQQRLLLLSVGHRSLEGLANWPLHLLVHWWPRPQTDVISFH